MTFRLRVIDLETTGFEPSEGAVPLEAAWVNVDPQWSHRSALFAYDKPIPPTARAVHHIGPEDVSPSKVGDPKYEVYPIEQLTDILMSDGGADILAFHNAAFDRQFLPELNDIPYICTYRAALHLHPAAPGHGNQALRYWRDVHPPADMLAGLVPHRALYDAACTAALLKDMLATHTPEELVKLTQAPVLLHTAKFGRYRGELWKDIPASYLRWILREGTFGPDVNHTCEHYLGL